MANGPYTREAWNDIIDRVNQLCENPPEDTDCEPIEPLEPVEPEHIWTVGDIDTVRQKLMEICEDNTFEEELDFWKSKVIEEIEAAISVGWCDCEQEICQADVEETVIYSGRDRNVYVVVPHGCDVPTNQCPYWERGSFDYYSIGIAATGFAPGIGGSISIRREITNTYGRVFTAHCYYNRFVCDGSQETPLPTPIYDGNGVLRNSKKDAEQLHCLPCGDGYYGASAFGYCQCVQCWSGFVSCSPPPAPVPPPYPCWTPPPCNDTGVDEGYVRDYYGNPQDSDGSLYEFIMEKRPSGPIWSQGAPCRTCCSDGIGWCIDDDCPGDPACEGEDDFY